LDPRREFEYCAAGGMMVPPSPKAVETLKSLNSFSIDSEIPIVHHYIFGHNNRRYSYDRDYIDHSDGAVTGYVVGLDRNNYIVSRELFRIEPDGNIIKKGVFRNFALNRKVIKEISEKSKK
jgi:hypothetical protein